MHELGERFGVLIFLGDVPEDPKTFPRVRRLAPRILREAADTVSEGFVPQFGHRGAIWRIRIMIPESDDDVL
jgi:hypothetical protein